MPKAVVTGSGGLIGSETASRLVESGFDVIGIENDTRAALFGPGASTAHVTERLNRELDGFRTLELDIRDADGISGVLAENGAEVELVVHTAAQPSHDWAVKDPQADFAINANGTLNLLEATRQHCPEATFIFTSTNKVYGDTPNRLPLEQLETRLELPEDHPYFGGIDTTMSIDATLHSLFGASKTAADLLVQEYGRYFEMPTVCFRAGCLTGPNHAGAQLHGFLAYLMKCTVTGEPYTVFGYDGYQVRDNLHSADLVDAFLRFHESPRAAAIYNIGGGRENACSMREAIELCERIAGRELSWEMSDDGADRRPPLVDQRPRRVQLRLRRLAAAARPGDDPARDPRGQRRALGLPAGMKLSVVIPAYNEEGAVGETVRSLVATLDREGIEHEIVVVDDSSTDGTAAVVAGIAEQHPQVRSLPSPYRNGFGFAVRAGLESFEGDAVAIVMADGSDSPEDLVAYQRLLEEGYECAFGSRFIRGSKVTDYPRSKLIMNRIVNWGIRLPLPPPLQRHHQRLQGLPPRGDRERQTAALPPLQPDRRAAAEGRRPRLQLRRRPDLLDQPHDGRLEAAPQRDGQPLPVHRPLRLPRAPPQPRRLPPGQLTATAVAVQPRQSAPPSPRRLAWATRAQPPSSGRARTAATRRALTPPSGGSRAGRTRAISL